MDAEIEERKRKNAEYENIMSEHQRQITETKEALDDAVKLIKDVILCYSRPRLTTNNN